MSRRGMPAVLVIGVTVVLALAACTNGSGDRRPGPSTRLSSVGLETSKPSVATVGDAARPCVTGALAVADVSSGDALGTQITNVLLVNTSPSTCSIGGVPVLTGVGAGGAARSLGVVHSDDPSVVLQPAAGPGPLVPGGNAVFKVTMQLNNCSTPSTTLKGFSELRIKLSSSDLVVTPFPRVLTVSGCLYSVSGIGLGTK